ncbi:aminopeptidase [Paractinoplanes brasiliensis]|uniref:Aminopeptidase n=1 Tax=Paractinoplanes brasiliensis TaxID=52695 RepID=A0A4R6JXE9_9ACTN|nr:aminopeptidase [Actinoplanes brasiliensis]TDO41483.1 aminopeptidase [Actinoplanes brasiliensis]GID27233.1 aminopeptidase [Actinoplanes brasiliensis]
MVLIERFAELVVRGGINVQPGQGVVLYTDTAHLEIARAVTEAAYAAGAAWVEPIWSDGPMRRSAVRHASIQNLSAVRPWALARVREWTDAGAAWIRLLGEADPHLLDGLDPAKVAAHPAEEMQAMRRAVFDGMRWTVVGAPNPGWAREVFGEPDIERLWEAVGTAMRLDLDDPVAAWQSRAEMLAERGRRLDELELTELRYHGEGTDLTVGLLPDSRWKGGGLVDDAGIPYLPNIPTEEVFTSPDRRRADGVIRVTRPVVIAGQVITGLRVTFAGGRITEVSADDNADVVRAHLDTDEGARRLGEVALVDRDSRIARTGVVFHNMLFDENAACHVAWGQSFPFAVAGGGAMTEQQRADLGLNMSSVHTDVVIGGEGISVTGRGPRGTVDIIKADEWVL